MLSILLATSLLLTAKTTEASTTISPPIVEEIQQIKLTEIPPVTTIEDKITYYANTYGVSRDVMDKIVACESGYDPSIQSYAYYKNGKREDSWGLVQIHLPAHKDITKAQALDPDFALNFLASNLAKGKGHLWSCYNQLLSKLD